MARSFPTSSDHIVVNFTTPVSRGFSWSGWLLPVSTSSTAFLRDGSGGGGANGAFCLPAFNVFANSTFAASTFTPTVGTWCQLGFSCTTNTNGISFFANGAAAGTNGSNQVVSGATAWWLGNDAGNRPSGNIHDFAFWNAILSPGEWVALGAGVRPGQIRRQSLVAWWPFDGYGHPALDRSGFANNGVLTGTAFAVSPPKISAAPIFVTQNLKHTSAAAAAGVVFRRTLSSIGTRTGSRQAMGTT